MKKIYHVLTGLVIVAFVGIGLMSTGVVQFKKETTEPAATDSTNQQAVQTPQAPPSYAQHILKGDNYAQNNQFILAFNEYILANKISPQATEPLLKIGKLHLRQNDPEKAREVFQQILLRDTNNLEANIYLGKTYILERKPEKALEIFNTIQQKNQLASYYKGLLAAYKGDYENSKALLQEAIDMNASPDVTANAQEVMKSFQIFAATDGGQITYLKTLIAKSFNKIDEYTLAIPVLFDVVKEKKDYRDAWILLGYAYLNTNDANNAIQALGEAQKLDPYKPETLFFLGLANQQTGNKDQAIALIEDAVKKGFEPKIQALQKLADLYFEAQNYEKAAENYEKVIQINSGDVSYFVRPMWLYIDKLKNPEKAQSLANLALKTHPNEAMTYNLVGWSLLANKKYNDAKSNLAKAIEMDPSLSAAYLNLGTLFEDLQYFTTAKNYYKTAFDMGKGTSVGDTAAQHYNALLQKENTGFQTNTLQNN